MSVDLQSAFNPQSIAIVGVSHEPQKVGYIVAKNILDQGYQGDLFFINPHAEEILGKKVYKSLSDVKQPIELAILAVPSQVALGLLEELHNLGIKNIVLYAAGFKETNDEGKKREEALLKKAKEYHLTVLGPNCLGFVNTSQKINATFLKSSSPVGNISMISQSGALGSVMIDYFVDHNTYGFSYFISLGNKTVVDESDCLEFLAKDEKTKVIGMYLEDVKDGPRFRDVLRKVTKLKPVVILKSGTSSEGSKAALSHTGGLVGDAQVYSAAFDQGGAVHADTYEQFMQLLKMYSFSRVPTSSSVLILSNAGGVGVLLTDELVKHKLQMVTISEQAKQQIEAATTHDGFKRITVHNPIDLLGDASAFDYQQAIQTSTRQSDIGSVVVLLTPQANTEILETAKVIITAQTKFDKPIFPVFMGSQSTMEAHRLFEKNHMVSFESYEVIPVIIEKILKTAQFSHKNGGTSHSPESLSALAHEAELQDILELASNKKFLNLQESMAVLELADIHTTPLHMVKHEEELDHLSRKLHFPVVAKIASDEITHKTEVKGVITGIRDLSELKSAFKNLSAVAGKKGCYVQQMVHGTELFVGVKRDSTFGPVVVYGLGGILVELLQEVSQFIYPFSPEELENGLKNTRFMKIVNGFRGSAPVNLKELHAVGMKLGFLLSRFDRIQAIDINPLFANEKGLSAADSRVILS